MFGKRQPRDIFWLTATQYSVIPPRHQADKGSMKQLYLVQCAMEFLDSQLRPCFPVVSRRRVGSKVSGGGDTTRSQQGRRGQNKTDKKEKEGRDEDKDEQERNQGHWEQNAPPPPHDARSGSASAECLPLLFLRPFPHPVSATFYTYYDSG